MIALHRLVLVALLSSISTGADAFVVPTYHSSGISPSILHRTGSNSRSSTELHASKRREVFGKLKRVLFAGSIATAFKSREPAFAEDATPSPVTGKVVVMEIGNVDGEEGKTGTVKIQLHPEWAPKGVQRFEQLTEAKFWDGCR
jgi:hypothetical protein